MTPLRWIRLIFYPCAAALAAFLLWGGPGAGGQDTGSVLYGQTAQGAPLRMNLDADGRPVAFETTIDARCTDNSLWFFRWTWDGESEAEGTVKLVEDFTTTVGERYSCPSGPVKFSAQR